MKKICLSDEQRAALEELWFLYGNEGRRHTMGNHRFIQMILERGVDHRDFYKTTADCQRDVDAILDARDGE